MSASSDLLPVGQVAVRSGLSVPTLRYYEQRGLIASVRSAGNQRRYQRSILRRLAFITAAQRVGLTLEQICTTLAALPTDRAPNQRDWTRLSAGWQQLIAGRIRELEALQHSLDGCIGCGCLSLARCALLNAGDGAGAEGPGSRWLRKAAETSMTYITARPEGETL